MDARTIWVADHQTESVAEHAHDYYQLLFCHTSGGVIRAQGVDYPALENHLFLIKPMVPHAFVCSGPLRLIELKFMLGPEDAKELGPLLDGLPVCFTLPEKDAVRYMLTGIVREGCGTKPFCNARTNARLLLFLTHCIQEIVEVPAEELQTADLCSSPIVVWEQREEEDFQRLHCYIEENLEKRITLQDLSQVVHFNKAHIIEVFKNLMGTTPVQYINRMRLRKAKELLATTDKSITEIAMTAGFQSIHYFSRYFKEKERISPLLYRERHQQRAAEDIGASSALRQ